MVFVLEMKTLI